MELITRCFVEHGSALTRSLLHARFSVEQVTLSLPEAALAIFESTQKTSLFQTIASLLPDASGRVTGVVDVDSIAAKSGMSSLKASMGLNAIAPILAMAIAQESNGLVRCRLCRG